MNDLGEDAGDEGRWVSYRELAAARGITLSSAIRLAMRRKWPRRPGNDNKARVAVPLAELAPDHGDNQSVAPPDDAVTEDVAAQLLDRIEAIEARLHEALARQVARADQLEADRAEAQAGREEARVRAAAAEGEARGLRDALDHARRPAWRRWLGVP